VGGEGDGGEERRGEEMRGEGRVPRAWPAETTASTEVPAGGETAIVSK
jgi:hypothetical protein